MLRLNRWTIGLCLLALVLTRRVAPAQDEQANEQPRPIGKVLTISSPVGGEVEGRVRNTALALQNEAASEGRPAVLILEITRGTSSFGAVLDLAKFLTAPEIASVRTVAWVPESVDGNNVILALACDEIVMHPDASLGDVGRGETADKDVKSFVLNMVGGHHNSRVNRSLAEAMLDPQVELSRIKLEVGEGDQKSTETRVVTAPELRKIQATNAVIREVDVIKPQGEPGRFSGDKARRLDVLAVKVLESRADVAETYRLPPEALREDAVAGGELKPRVIEVEGVIDFQLQAFIERQIGRALKDDVNLLIFRINSPGGLMHASTQLAYTIADLDPKRVRTVAYVPEMALSGAAIISAGCDEIYLHERARIGTAAPISVGEGGQFERAPEKVLSILRGDLAKLGQMKNRPPALLMAMADKDLRVYRVTHNETGRVWFMSDAEIENAHGQWKKGPIVAESRENNLLTLDGQRASELMIARPPVADFDDLKQRLGIPADSVVPVSGQTWVDKMVFALNTPTALFLLFLVGVVCIFLELHMMTGILGIVSALCFTVFFWSRFLGGTAGWLEVLLFLLGIGCILMEIFVIPGFGVFGVSGGLLIITSFVLASQTFVVPETSADYDRMYRSLGTIGLSILAVFVVGAFLSRYLPQMPLFSAMILTPPGPGDLTTDGPRLRPELAGGGAASALAERNIGLLGERGSAESTLRPAGKARFGDLLVDVVSQGPYIEQGAEVEVVEAAGNRVVVREV